MLVSSIRPSAVNLHRPTTSMTLASCSNSSNRLASFSSTWQEGHENKHSTQVERTDDNRGRGNVLIPWPPHSG